MPSGYHGVPIATCCGRPHLAKGLCKRHYAAANRTKYKARISEYHKTYYKKPEKRILAIRRNRKHKWAKFGGTLERYAELSKAQNGKCAICCKEAELYWDHDHRTNTPRQLLCFTCNSGLGAFKDDKSFLKRAIDYLESNENLACKS